MTKQEFEALVARGPVLLDGAMGSNLLERGMPKGALSELWADRHPETVLELQAAYAAALSAQRAMNIGGWYGLGYNISAGVASGVYGGSYLITAAARTAAQNALAAAKRSLGVNSPSRVFRDQVGKMIPAGMAEGISMATPMAQKAVTLSAQTLRDTGRAALDPSGGTVVEAMGAMERPGAQTTAQFTGNLVLEAPLYLDGREIARASAKYTGRQMAYLEGL